MSISATQLLKQLEPAIRPGASFVPAARGAAQLEFQSFEQLLALASRGGVPSGRQVACECDVQPPLEASQLERLAIAADQAEAAGAKQAVMLIDGRGFVMNIKDRTLVSEISASAGGIASAPGVDFAMHVPIDAAAAIGTALKPPSAMPPASLFKQLQGVSAVTRTQ